MINDNVSTLIQLDATPVNYAADALKLSLTTKKLSEALNFTADAPNLPADTPNSAVSDNLPSATTPNSSHVDTVADTNLHPVTDALELFPLARSTNQSSIDSTTNILFSPSAVLSLAMHPTILVALA
jgi:hypothetical protein